MLEVTVGRLALFLDYDGTLVPIAHTPAEAQPDGALLARLCAGDVATALCEQAYTEEVRSVLNAPAQSMSDGRRE